MKSYEIFEEIQVYNPFNSRDSGYTYLNPINLYKLFKILKKNRRRYLYPESNNSSNRILSFFAKIRDITFLYFCFLRS